MWYGHTVYNVEWTSKVLCKCYKTRGEDTAGTHGGRFILMSLFFEEECDFLYKTYVNLKIQQLVIFSSRPRTCQDLGNRKVAKIWWEQISSRQKILLVLLLILFWTLFKLWTLFHFLKLNYTFDSKVHWIFLHNEGRFLMLIVGHGRFHSAFSLKVFRTWLRSKGHAFWIQLLIQSSWITQNKWFWPFVPQFPTFARKLFQQNENTSLSGFLLEVQAAEIQTSVLISSGCVRALSDRHTPTDVLYSVFTGGLEVFKNTLEKCCWAD